jgi:hypothetical protein
MPDKRIPNVGERVLKDGKNEYIVSKVSPDGNQVDLTVPGTNLKIYRVLTSTLNFPDRPTARKPAKAKPKLDAADLMERIGNVQRDSLQRLDDDIDILMKYLKTKGAPKAVLDALEDLSSEQHKSWKTAIERIAGQLEE